MSSELLAVIYGIASAITWGTGDFAGGLASKKNNSLVVVLIAHIFGTFALFFIALILGETFPDWRDMAFGAAAGLFGTIGLAAFYQALSQNTMGLVASFTASVSAAVPVIFAAFTEGLPANTQIVGFALAIIAVVVISATGGIGGLKPQDLVLPIVAGFGFGSFFILIAQANEVSVYWPLVSARISSVLFLTILILLTKSWERPARSNLPFILLAGIFDTAGNTLFTLASAVGRLDIAAVLSSLYPATTVLLAWFFLKERLTGYQWLGVALALSAVVLIAL